jgi:23S rRNA (pseudouridine1915-N3)-methyltransferase
MKLVIVAVGERMPGWVEDGVGDYRRRFPRKAPLELIEVRPEKRVASRTIAQILAAEAKRIEACLPEGCRRIALDERGRDVTTAGLARLARAWIDEGRDVAFLIGGPDGLDPGLKGSAEAALRVSSLTLPHALVRIVIVEQLYRALSILDNHPYHRA